MARSLPVEQFLVAPGPILDVRSPGEYTHGHIPGAIAFPLFDDAERAQVGICYKYEGRDAAVELGFRLAGKKFADLIATARTLAEDRRVRVHCWRGGMRSEGVGWVLSMGGFDVALLEGGYKAFRRWVRQCCATPKPIVTLGGMTGTAKTEVLHALGALGEQVLDLESLANHRGSSYGGLGMPPQPTTEQFENDIAIAWQQFDPQRPIWIEAESRGIGTCRIPAELFQQMMAAPILEIVRPREERIAYLAATYGLQDREALAAATLRITKRLGKERAQAAADLFRAGKAAAAIAIVLDYYDRTYRFDLERRSVSRHSVTAAGLSPHECARLLRDTLAAMPCTLNI